ncbi:YggT family protein [Aliidiomarina halalkaliphila]|uniref:YggT family protein n=1 Tax=Aliidiomarina halalkaliphila TaxID=2593535 RepID=A0A552WYQ7_9GAMM|nr:YggT family protein [Aliidiomarina halalkaliphila]TRW47948.1 YggT family protein [Aliidiomarina halalkaliphila]
MSNGATFLVQTIFDLFIMAVILRLWMQLARVDYFNPFSQFIVKITSPVLNPLRRVFPTLGRFDIAAAFLATALAALKIFVIVQMQVGAFPYSVLNLFMASIQSVLIITLQLMFWILIIRAILSWFSQGRNPIEFVFAQLTEPMLAPIRRIIPPIGGLDLSVLVLIILVQFVRISIMGAG